MFTELSYVKRISVLPRSKIWAISLKNIPQVWCAAGGVQICCKCLQYVQSQQCYIAGIIIDDDQLKYVVAVM